MLMVQSLTFKVQRKENLHLGALAIEVGSLEVPLAPFFNIPIMLTSTGLRTEIAEMGCRQTS